MCKAYGWFLHVVLLCELSVPMTVKMTLSDEHSYLDGIISIQVYYACTYEIVERSYMFDVYGALQANLKPQHGTRSHSHSWALVRGVRGLLAVF